MKYKYEILNAFPKLLETNVRSLLQKKSLISEFQLNQYFIVNFQGETLQIPYRVYFQEVNEDNLNENETLILNCIFTRHYNGFIRQKHLEKILLSEESFVSPFVFQLLGEYVIQILDSINNNLSEKMIESLVSFAHENPTYLQITKSRMASYWNEYYRHQFLKGTDYTGFKILEKLNLATN